MKVLQINSVCGTGSTGRIAADLSELLQRCGHECCIAFGRSLAPPGITSYKFESSLGVGMHALLSRLTGGHGLYSRFATDNLIKFIAQYNPDIVQLHNIHGYFLNFPKLFDFLSRLKIPVVWTFHDCWPFTGHCAHFDYAGCNKWMQQCYKCEQIDRYPQSLFIDRTTKNFELKKKLFLSLEQLKIITPSKWLLELVKDSFFRGIDAVVVNNGIDLNIFNPTQSDFRTRYNIHNKTMILGVSSVWTAMKGYYDFIKLADVVDHSTCQLVMVGLDRFQIRALPKSIIGLPRTDDVKELAKLYTAADVFFNPTYQEVLGLTNLEALACKTPVITYRTGGSPECLNEKCGFVIERGDYKSILSLLPQIKSISSNYCREFSKKFDKHKKYLEYLKIYESLIR